MQHHPLRVRTVHLLAAQQGETAHDVALVQQAG